MNENVLPLLRAAREEFLGAFLTREEQFIFDGIALDIPTQEGFVNLPSVMQAPVMEQLVDEFSQQGWDLRNNVVITDVYGAIGRVQRRTFENARALTDGGINVIFSDLGRQPIVNRERILTRILELNPNDVAGAPFFAAAAAIFGPGSSVTNTVAQTATTAAGIQVDFQTIRGLAAANLGASNARVNAPALAGGRWYVMFHPALAGAMENAFSAQSLPGGGQNTLYNRAILRENPYLVNQNAWYAFPENAAAALVLAHSQPSLQSNVGGMSSGIEGIEFRDGAQMLNDAYLFGARDEALATTGSRLSAYRVA